MVADVLSRLDIDEVAFKDSTKTFLGLMDCNVTKDIKDFQPLNYQQLQKAQLTDKTMMKLLKDDNTEYCQKEFHGGEGISFITYKDKIVIPARLQKHLTMWYHTMPCHPGINGTKETMGQHLW